MANLASERLLDLAPELLELCLTYLPPSDVVSFGQTCRRANAFIHPSNQTLWKAAFLHVYDDPNHAWNKLVPTARAQNRSREAQWSWHEEVRKRGMAFDAVCQPTNAILLLDPEPIITTLLDVLQTASCSGLPSRNIAFLSRLFETAPNPERIVHDYHRDIESVSLPLQSRLEEDRPVTRSMLEQRAVVPDWASRFHIFYGMTRREKDSVRSKGSARALVYSWLGTNETSEHGPFLRDGSGMVNWQLLEATTSLMHRIFDIARKLYHYRMPSGFENNYPCCLPPNVSMVEDWAGVGRAWIGTYAFLDYRALVHYNFADRLEHPTDLGHQEEACGDLMCLNLVVSQSEEIQNDPRLQTELPYCKDLPILYFTGSSNNNSTGRLPISVKGFACLVVGGREVKWRFVIGYAGTDQWQLEGVQPGGVRSGGIFGLWSHVDHEPNGPIGPFSYFPVEVCEAVN
ncbi:hypothetical protein B0J11DRAFT_106036 [Dendryphion nanum]|uniref:F-box domain-containing protein n=1 Tax=Dendryphion nanum TaxID=256645 RepID=A0A9P9DCT4_9PLEO|nr:hypothetical protein B0J11DRAFT_106036 [Dendryphion nanum]